MAIKRVKPTSQGRRFQEYPTFEEITKKEPEKGLLRRLTRSGGRNANGRMTMRYRGGGHKRQYRLIDFKREKDGVPAKVATIEYDPNRSARIALLHYADGEKRYILAPAKVKVGDLLMSGPDAEIRPGNALPLRNIPLGTQIHNIELRAGNGGQIVKSAGGYAQITAKEGKYATIRLPSGEVRMVLQSCRASIGQIGNVDHVNISLGKAGRTRMLGRRPKVRGVVKNPVDHPMGGGEGRSSGGRHPCTPWGKPTKGLRTRSRKKSDRLIVKRRKKKR